MKILFLPNWKVHQLEIDNNIFQAPDKHIRGEPYWFFKYFSNDCHVDIIDCQKNSWISFLEKKVNFYILQGVKAFFKSGKYDLVISHGAQSGLVYSLLNTITLRKSPPHLIFDIGAMNGARKNFLENSFIAFALKSRPYIICHSKVVIDYYESTYKSLISRSCFIPFGVDIDDFSPEGTNQEGEYILSFGYAKRDYETLFKAWHRIKTDKKLRVIGYKKEISFSNIEIIDKVSIEELKKQISNALFVIIPLPVFNYSYGQMSFLQSMSLGKTVIVTKTPSSVDYLKDGEGSLYVNPYDAIDMQEKIRYLLENKEALNNSNKRARQYVIKYFSEKDMAEKIFKFIQSNLGI